MQLKKENMQNNSTYSPVQDPLPSSPEHSPNDSPLDKYRKRSDPINIKKSLPILQHHQSDSNIRRSSENNEKSQINKFTLPLSSSPIALAATAAAISTGSEQKRLFLISRLTDPTSYFYQYHCQKEEKLLPEKNIQYALVDINWLKPHEEIVSLQRVHGLKNAIIQWDAYTQPLLIDGKTGAILDGHHRYTVGKDLKLRQLPVVTVDYLGDESITVDVWPESRYTSITKEQVIEMALSENLFPPKTSRHHYAEKLPPISVSLSILRNPPFTS